jgi:hypothetical protein
MIKALIKVLIIVSRRIQLPAPLEKRELDQKVQLQEQV